MAPRPVGPAQKYRPDFQQPGLQDPNVPFHPRQIQVAVMHGLLIGRRHRQVARHHVTAVQLRLLFARGVFGPHHLPSSQVHAHPATQPIFLHPRLRAEQRTLRVAFCGLGDLRVAGRDPIAHLGPLVGTPRSCARLRLRMAAQHVALVADGHFGRAGHQTSPVAARRLAGDCALAGRSRR